MPTVARINDQEQLPGAEWLKGLFKFSIRDGVREDRLHALCIQLRAAARITKVVRDQVELILLRRAVPGKVDDDGIFRLRMLGQLREGGRDLGLRRVCIVERQHFDALICVQLFLLPFDLGGERLRISHRIL